MAVLTLATVVAVLSGYVTLLGSAELAVFAAVAFGANSPGAKPARRMTLTVTAALLALLLAMHLLPGFHNPLLLHAVKVVPDGSPFTLYANFDKGAVGLILLAFFCKRTSSWREFFTTIKKAAPVALLTFAVAFAAALALHLVRVEVKLPPSTGVFLLTNLFFTCVAEEAFFRGFLQEKLSVALAQAKNAHLITIACSGVLFGLVHLAGGPAYMAVATLAGIGYAYIYAATKRIEASILTHFVFNMLHFIGFTYPVLA